MLESGLCNAPSGAHASTQSEHASVNGFGKFITALLVDTASGDPHVLKEPRRACLQHKSILRQPFCRVSCS